MLVEDFSLDFQIPLLDLGNKTDVISVLTMTIDVDNIKANLHGIINDELVSNEISEVISNVLVPYLKENFDEVNEQLSLTVKTLLNAIIEAVYPL